MSAGRFAPSPTSELHLGNLRTALLAWLFARRQGLRFVVRVEDLDQQRVAAAPAMADQQLRDLESIGLDWDGEVVRQSQRLDLFAKIPHAPFPGGRVLRTPLLVLAMAWYRMRDALW